MAGKNQHYIPRAVLGGFAIPEARTPQVYVFHTDKSFPSSITNTAAEDYFYSGPSADGSETLDQMMTRYENGAFDQGWSRLAAAEAGPVDAEPSASIVGHLITRVDHLRGLVRSAAPIMAGMIQDLLGGSEQIARAMGVDGARPSDRFRQKFDEALAGNDVLLGLGLPSVVLQDLTYMLVRENRRQGFDDVAGAVAGLAGRIRAEAPEIARNAQVKALSASMVPEGRVEVLRRLHWRIEEVAEPTFVLPDFLGLAADREGRAGTIFSFDAEEFGSIWMPLSPLRMLIGELHPGDADLRAFNARAVPHCLRFFVSAYLDDGLEALRPTIGSSALEGVHEGLAEAAAEFRVGLAAPPSTDPEAGTGDWLAREAPDIRLHTDLESSLAESLTRVLAQIAGHARQRFDIDGVVRIVATADYEEALASAPSATAEGQPIRPSTEGWSAAYNVPVEEEGRHGIAMVLHPDTVGMLLAENDTLFASGASIVLAQFARAGVERLLGSVFEEGLTIGGGTDRLVLPWAMDAWRAYHVAGCQCLFAPEMAAFYWDRFIEALEALDQKLVKARRAYWLSGKVDELLKTALAQAAQVLESAACAAASLDEPAGRQQLERFSPALQTREMARWFDLLREDLSEIWQQGNRFPDQERFLVLVPHIQRLLGSAGLFPWDDGSPLGRVEVPHWTDYAWIAEQMGQRPSGDEEPPGPDDTEVG